VPVGKDMLRGVLLLVFIVSVVTSQEGEITWKLVQWIHNNACSQDILELIASRHFKESKTFQWFVSL
jgi:hypothetical protein